MKHKRYRLLSLGALTLVVAVSAAARESQNRPIFGSYTVLSAVRAEKGLTHVTVKIRLINPTAETLSVERIGPWREPGTRTGNRTLLDLAAHGSGEITQEFTVATYEYLHWLRTARLVFQATCAGPDQRPRIVPVELTRTPWMGVN